MSETTDNLLICDGYLLICETKRQIIYAINKKINVGANGLIGPAIERIWKKTCQKELKKFNINFSQPYEPIFVLSKETHHFVNGMTKFDREIWHVIIGEKIGWIYVDSNWKDIHPMICDNK